MPIRNVYGKKTNKHRAATSAFTWSSPEESPLNVASTKNEASEVTRAGVVRTQLEEGNTDIADKKLRQRKILSVRDANSAVWPEVLQPTYVDEATKKNIRRSPRLKTAARSSERCESRLEGSPTRRTWTPLPPGPPPVAPQSGRRDSPLEHPGRSRRRQERNASRIGERATASDPLIRPLLDLVSEENGAKGPIPFKLWTTDLETDFAISKIAEASFAQVYLLQRKQPTGDQREDQSILKIISLNPAATAAATPDQRPPKVRDTSSDIPKVVSEVKLLDRMTEIPGFTNLREVSVLSGQPSAPFIAAWKEWNKKRRKTEKSYFPDPSRRANYSEDQLWAVIEMDHAGFDLEHPDTIVDDVESLWDVFWGVAITLAKGEEDVKFEHRDLHLGNVCVTRRAVPKDPQHKRRKLGASGLETTIIDYTLSRAEIETTPNGVEVVCVDLASEGIFDGDASQNYQYDLYRHMRSVVFLDDPLGDFASSEGNRIATSWLEPHLTTNVVWLHFLLHELWPKVVQAEASNDIGHRASEQLDELVTTKKEALAELFEELRLENWCANGFRSARDLVLLALERSWLDPEHVSGDTADVEDITAGLSKLDLLKDPVVQPHVLLEIETSCTLRPQRGC